MVREDWVVVEGDAFGALSVEVEIRVSGVPPPLIERLEVRAPVQQIVEPQTEARSAQSVRPDLGVLAVATLGAREPLAMEMLGDPTVSPAEGVRVE